MAVAEVDGGWISRPGLASAGPTMLIPAGAIELTGPIHDELDGAVSYRDLHILRLYYRGRTGT